MTVILDFFYSIFFSHFRESNITCAASVGGPGGEAPWLAAKRAKRAEAASLLAN